MEEFEGLEHHYQEGIKRLRQQKDGAYLHNVCKWKFIHGDPKKGSVYIRTFAQMLLDTVKQIQTTNRILIGIEFEEPISYEHDKELLAQECILLLEPKVNAKTLSIIHP